MAEPYISEIKIFGFGWPPLKWALCDGQLLPISQNTALYSLVGTAYGGDGRANFGIPELRGRTPVHQGSLGNYQYARGNMGGAETVTLRLNQLAAHTHTVSAALDNGEFNPGYEGAYFATCIDGKTDQPASVYRSATNLAQLNPSIVSSIGGGQAHENRQPSLVMSFCIALEGVYPSRN
ncbi:phage tail protein [Hahella ganghwensis]|uniref:phage tail protein n=1 Tax=Hahella ganghwensis TaxID=286420 RepID=UPI0003814735|nr:tail fiber protein [Hahella ganghwensis]